MPVHVVLGAPCDYLDNFPFDEGTYAKHVTGWESYFAESLNFTTGFRLHRGLLSAGICEEQLLFVITRLMLT